ncbi:hypothetical protein M7I_2805 [Glarea lozoyensis 74030]|uniref:Uncharacterized protein n=1 Tax=Glarea lozoyensis (strain ATCC 74030 / MF5533) TaxID=1104152 RepID=H0EJS5_GLAL7|nr:hypothetical protein M7I_2805 [Glarea lozoyensis 74030]
MEGVEATGKMDGVVEKGTRQSEGTHVIFENEPSRDVFRYRKLPAELRTMILDVRSFDEATQSRDIQFLRPDGSIEYETTVRIEVDMGLGRVPRLLCDEFLALDKITCRELLERAAEKVTFKPVSPLGLKQWSSKMASMSVICGLPLGTRYNVAVDFTVDMGIAHQRALKRFQRTDRSHGFEQKTHDHIRRWLTAMESTTENTAFVLVFPAMWRDFRGLQNPGTLPPRLR